MRALAFILLATLAGSCRASLEGASCPCVQGYHCNDALQVCEPGDPMDDGGSPDGGVPDAGFDLPDAEQGFPDAGLGTPDADQA